MCLKYEHAVYHEHKLLRQTWIMHKIHCNNNDGSTTLNKNEEYLLSHSTKVQSVNINNTKLNYDIYVLIEVERIVDEATYMNF